MAFGRQRNASQDDVICAYAIVSFVLPKSTETILLISRICASLNYWYNEGRHGQLIHSRGRRRKSSVSLQMEVIDPDARTSMQATLLASTECSFLSLLKGSSDGSPESNPTLQRTVVTLTYIAIFLNVGASWSSLRMIDTLGKMPLLNARHEAELKKNFQDPRRFSVTSETTVDGAMKSHGLSGRWTFMAWHCTCYHPPLTPSP